MRGIGLQETVICLQRLLALARDKMRVAELEQRVARARVVGMRAHEGADPRRASRARRRHGQFLEAEVEAGEGRKRTLSGARHGV